MALTTPSPAATLQTRVCVIGSGPAGIACTLELARLGIDVILVEGGGAALQPATQAAGEAEIVDGLRHAPMSDAVGRALGGTSWLWGGRCIPFDPVDFAARDHAPGAAWPISYDEVAPWYRTACTYANCGQPAFTLGELDAPTAQRPLTGSFRPGDVIATDLERWAGEPVFARRYAEALRDHPNVRLLLDAACIDIDLDPNSEQVRGVVVAQGGEGAADRSLLRIEAERFVLACGGLGVTQLLLDANTRCEDRLGNRSDMLGRHYMGHISGKIASVRFNAEPGRTIYHFERDRDGFYARRRLTVPAEVQRREGLLNTAMWLDNHPPADPAHGNGVLSLAYLALRTPGLNRMLTAPAIAKAVTAANARGGLGAHWRNVIRAVPQIATFVPPFIYRRYLARPRLPGFFLPSPNNVYALHYHAEQLPHADSRVTLADTTDRHGLRRLRIDLRYQQADAESVVRTHQLLDRHLRETGAGQLDFWVPEAERPAHVMAHASDGFHQIGTARMAADWREGVVDTDCRVFGTRNLYVASSAVFPSSGQANPTLTILALSARLADHLGAQLRAGGTLHDLRAAGSGAPGRLADVPMAARTAGGIAP
ncbi:FAD-dependent oxidoreductase [Cupriavidus agavae]|uniref:Choline dehydrogenase-like flavoprotein n=1 Tax=Cupriavidus agavae TaxID=1001822 RepID=A0A4Q7S6Y6_9BURK|nr:GMC family oxidoreductase [Cupriavidus agavae]RZT42151.1 choline dehydrogenase-like flavoprotein [Cupriavidus agavae]